MKEQNYKHGLEPVKFSLVQKINAPVDLKKLRENCLVGFNEFSIKYFATSVCFRDQGITNIL